MASKTGPNVGLTYSWDVGESGYNVQMDENFLVIDALLIPSVAGISSTPPTTPSEGDKYIIGASATGDWATYDDHVAIYSGTIWLLMPPRAGWELRASGVNYRYSAANGWEAQTVSIGTTDDLEEGNTNLYFSQDRVKETPEVVANSEKRTYPSEDEVKLAGIEENAEVNQTDAEVKAQYEGNPNTNAFTDEEKQKLSDLSLLALPNMDFVRETNKSKYVASGYVNFGKHGSNNVDQGLWCDLTTPNEVKVGKEDGDGNSETDYPVIHIAGFETSLEALKSIKLPEAPDGTVVYDSTGDCRDTGNATIDLATEIDPKYGDVAVDHNEAVARAFEGVVKNGDLRDGSDHWYSNGTISVVDGHLETTSDIRSKYTATLNSPVIVGETYRVSVGVEIPEVNADYPNDHGIWAGFASAISNITLQPDHLSEDLQNSIGIVNKFTQDITITEGGKLYFIVATERNSTKLNLYGLTITRVTEEVVTDRVDLAMYEGFLEEVSIANPYVYPFGTIQGDVTGMEGIACEDSNRPDTYYSWYEGDVTSRGQGVDFFSLTNEQQNLLYGTKHNIYKLPNGDVVQWRIRGRSIAGAGNGDWENVDCRNGALSFDDTDLGYNYNNEKGCFDDGNETYALVAGTVPRLNQGVHHPKNNSGSVTDSAGAKWYASSLLDTKADCFTYKGTVTGREDSKLYDLLQPSGLNGWIDQRLPARFMGSVEEASKYVATVKNGAARGNQKLVHTRVFDSVANIPTEYEIVNQDNASAIVAITEINTSVEGNATDGFTTQDVIGDPANIIQVDALSDGWYGHWCPVIPDGTSKEFSATRKSLVTSIAQAYTIDGGVTWSTSSILCDAASNSRTFSYSSSGVYIWTYQACPYVTKLDENKKVYNGEKGVGRVTRLQFYTKDQGGYLGESLVHKILTGVIVDTAFQGNYSVTSLSMNGYNNKLNENRVIHSPILNQFGPIGEVAVKTLQYQVEENSGLCINFAYNELKRNESDFGDTSKFTIPSTGEGTYTNLNGETCKMGTARTKRYGWC